MNTGTQTICLGKIGAAQGLKGFVRVQSWTEPKSKIFDYQPWILVINGESKQVHASLQSQSKHIIASIETSSNREQAQALTHAEIHISRQQLPEPKDDEYFLADLIGAVVYSLEQIELGTVKDVVNHGANDTMVVANHEKTYYIPLIDPFVQTIDLQKNTVLVDWDHNF